MNKIKIYLTEIELCLLHSPVIDSYRLVRSRAYADNGYIRFRAMLTNGDFLEVTSCFMLEEDQIVTIDYRYQWMDSNKTTLRKRWDSAPDHPELETFPYHVHIDSDENVLPYPYHEYTGPTLTP